TPYSPGVIEGGLKSPLVVAKVSDVLALVKAGQIPPEATVHQITVPVPLTVLAPPLATEQQHPEIGNVKPATVQEVNKDMLHGNEVQAG
ncbi:hypothetical protein DOY81_012406, partial [Sarcophaga bullata]